MTEPQPTLEQLTAWCREWQQRLRLQDWRVRIRFSEKWELDGNQARVTVNLALRSALILINPFANEQSDGDYAYIPYECRVIHELVHLHWEPLWPTTDRDSIQWNVAEAAVDSLAWGLYRAKHDHDARDAFTEAQ